MPASQSRGTVPHTPDAGDLRARRVAWHGGRVTIPAADIRPAGIDDVPAILEVQRLAGRSISAVLRDDVVSAVADPTRVLLVAVRDGVVGWATTRQFDDEDGDAPAGHYLMGVTVEPGSRRTGIGSRLIGERLAWIAARSPAAYFVANAANEASLAAHRRWGFVEIARGPRLRGIEFDGGEGVLCGARLASRQ
jgi:aminoglycoside 6'-N-acetyltransferase I